jgi:hypothetical protein
MSEFLLFCPLRQEEIDEGEQEHHDSKIEKCHGAGVADAALNGVGLVVDVLDDFVFREVG